MNLVQKTLIKRLVLKNGLRYSQLTKSYDYEDNVAYHLKQLREKGFITKDKNTYFLTPKGLKISGSFELHSLEEQEYVTLYVGLLAFYKNTVCLRNKGKLLYRIPGDKPKLGECKKSYIKRISNKEFGFSISDKNVILNSIQFKTNITSSKKVLFDNVLVVYSLEIDEKEYKQCRLRSENKWVRTDSLGKIKNVWPEVNVAVKASKEKNIEITDYTFTSDYNLLI